MDAFGDDCCSAFPCLSRQNHVTIQNGLGQRRDGLGYGHRPIARLREARAPRNTSMPIYLNPSARSDAILLCNSSGFFQRQFVHAKGHRGNPWVRKSPAGQNVRFSAPPTKKANSMPRSPSRWRGREGFRGNVFSSCQHGDAKLLPTPLPLTSNRKGASLFSGDPILIHSTPRRNGNYS